MNVSITLPDDVARQMRDQRVNLPRMALEALAAEGYRRGVITSAQVQRLLGHESRFETEAFLKSAKAFLDYSADDLREDLRALEELPDGQHP